MKEPNGDCIQKIREALERAESGQIQEVTIAAVTDTGNALCFYTNTDNRFGMAGILVMAALECMGFSAPDNISLPEIEKPKVN